MDAFLPPDNPALANRDEVASVFGIAEPILVLVVNEEEQGVFDPGTLQRIEWLTEEIASIPGINPSRVQSLTTEENIVGTADGVVIRRFFREIPTQPASLERIRAEALGSERYRHLLSRSGDAIVIMAELEEGADVGRVYRQLQEMSDRAPGQEGRIQIAGDPIVAHKLGESIQSDMKRLNLLCAAVITIVLVLSYRTAYGVFLPLGIVGTTAVAVLGGMGFAGEPFYVITNALPVILIAIGVADSMHILGYYYDISVQWPGVSHRTRVLETMRRMWAPITITSLTDIAGFLAIYAASSMPPMRAFGLMAAIGVGVAWGVSMLGAPAVLMWVKPKVLRRAVSRGRCGADDRTPLIALGALAVMRRYRWVLAAAGGLLGMACIFAGWVRVDDARIRNFRDGEAIKGASQTANTKLEGIHFLDLMVESDREEGLLAPKRLEKLGALERHALSLSGVTDVISFLDILRMTGEAINGDEDNSLADELPDSHALAAQYLLLFASGTGPTALESMIDYDYRNANMRVRMTSGKYTDAKRVVESIRDYLNEHFEGGDISVKMAGQVYVDYQWMNRLARHHFYSVGLALAAVWLMLSWGFGSVVTGVLALFPVGMAVVMIYGAMGLFGIWLNAGTSMFAAIAIGTGVDFAVYTTHTLKRAFETGAKTVEEAYAHLLETMGRPLAFSFLAVLLGFGLLMTSEVPPLIRFGLLITVSIMTSFLCSIVVLPALVKLLGPGCLAGKGMSTSCGVGGRGLSRFVAIGVIGTMFIDAGALTAAEGEREALPAIGKSEKKEWLALTGDEIAERVNGREDGEHVTRSMKIELIGRSGRARTRLTETFRKDYDDHRRRLIFYRRPPSVAGTAFLNIDFGDGERDDLRWLYLPATRKVRRISAANRGDHFLGTDFTYEDINNETKVNIEDYNRRALGGESVDGHWCLRMEAIPKSKKISKELGYGRVVSWVDPVMWMLRKADYWDRYERQLKTIRFEKIKKVQGIWTAFELTAENHQTGHKTVLTFSEVDYESPIPDRLFTQRTLRWGL